MKLPVQDFALIMDALRGTGTPTGAEKRQAVRINAHARLVVTPLVDADAPANRSFTAMMRDMSQAGIGLVQAVALPKGVRFVIALPRTANKPPIYMVSVVMHAQQLCDGIFGIGAEFVEAAGPALVAAIDGSGKDQLSRARAAVLA